MVDPLVHVPPIFDGKSPALVFTMVVQQLDMANEPHENRGTDWFRRRADMRGVRWQDMGRTDWNP